MPVLWTKTNRPTFASNMWGIIINYVLKIQLLNWPYRYRHLFAAQRRNKDNSLTSELQVHRSIHGQLARSTSHMLATTISKIKYQLYSCSNTAGRQAGLCAELTALINCVTRRLRLLQQLRARLSSGIRGRSPTELIDNAVLWLFHAVYRTPPMDVVT